MALDALHEHLLHTVHPLSFGQLLGFASRKGVASAIAAGTVVRVLPDCYASSVHAESWQTRASAALRWAGPEAILAGTSALAAWGVVDPPVGVSIAAPWEERPRGPAWMRVRRYVAMPGSADIHRRRTATPAWAVVQAHAELPPGGRAEAVYAPIRAGLVTPAEVADLVSRLPRVPARAELMRRLHSAATGVESYLEEKGGDRVLRGSEFDSVVRQHRVRVDGSVFRLDALHLETATDFEFDGGTHDSATARRRDSIRDLLLASVGILTVRFAYVDVVNRPEWCREKALTVLDRRRAGVLSVPPGHAEHILEY